MKKSLIPYKKSIFRKIIDFIKGNKEQEVQKQETKSKETVNRFRNQIKVGDKIWTNLFITVDLEYYRKQ